MTKIPMQLPYGAVYFRKSNPPREDWERDYAQASRDGYNIFRHWFMWGAIETAPGVYDWEDYDRQMELGERYGIKAIIAEMTTCVPEWGFTRYPEALCENADGRKSKSEMSVSCSVGGFYEGVCLDTAIGRELTGNFLEALAKRYKGHPSLLGYDVWNECNYSHDYCYCKDTKQMFRAWLKVRYGTLDALKEAWHRYSLTSWEEVQPPPKLALYTECNDWLLFRKEQAYHQMKWKTERLRAADPDCLITAHGTAQSLENMALGGSDEWMAGEQVEVYGLTFVQSRKGKSPGWFLGERTFQLAELKLLVDAVQSSKFITQRKSSELIRKLESQASVHQARQLQRQVYVDRRVKSMNESVYYTIDKLHTAIANRKAVTFKYFEYNVKKEKVFRREGKRYTVSPLGLIWDNENYYLAGYDHRSCEMRHYRVDKMAELAVTCLPLEGADGGFDIASYAQKHFGMFSGREGQITLRCRSLVGVVLDRFGRDAILVPDGEEHFTVTVPAVVSPQFLGWVFGLGDGVQILRPDWAAEELKRQLAAVAALYQ